MDIINNTSGNSQLIYALIDKVATVTGVSRSAMEGRSRKEEIKDARMIAMTVIYYRTKLPYKSIGEIFGARDHTTVLNAVHTLKDLIETGDSVKYLLAKVDSSLLHVLQLERQIKKLNKDLISATSKVLLQ